MRAPRPFPARRSGRGRRRSSPIATRDPGKRRPHELEESVHLRRRRLEQQEPPGFEQRGRRRGETGDRGPVRRAPPSSALRGLERRPDRALPATRPSARTGGSRARRRSAAPADAAPPGRRTQKCSATQRRAGARSRRATSSAACESSVRSDDGIRQFRRPACRRSRPLPVPTSSRAGDELPGPRAEIVERRVDEMLGFGPRNEHAIVDRKRASVKPRCRR